MAVLRLVFDAVPLSRPALAGRVSAGALSHSQKQAAQTFSGSKSYATQSSRGGAKGSSSTSHRRQVTVTTDDGRYRWSELSTGEKAARGTQQTFNFALVAAGATGTIVVAYFLYTELFAADSKTRQFNHAVDRVKADHRCTDLLGNARKIKAFGEPTTNKWARARPLAHTSSTDSQGVEHFRMHFHVEGPDNAGVVTLHMTKRPQDSELHYETLALNVKGHPTIYLEQVSEKSPKKAVKRLFGISLG